MFRCCYSNYRYVNRVDSLLGYRGDSFPGEKKKKNSEQTENLRQAKSVAVGSRVVGGAAAKPIVRIVDVTDSLRLS